MVGEVHGWKSFTLHTVGLAQPANGRQVPKQLGRKSLNVIEPFIAQADRLAELGLYEANKQAHQNMVFVHKRQCTSPIFNRASKLTPVAWHRWMQQRGDG